MTTVLLFHHVQGLTPGMHAFADELRQSGHTVHTPDFFGGRTFTSIEDGFAFTKESGIDTDALADQAADELPSDIVYAGFSMGVMSAQRLAQTRAGARGALLFEACIPITGEWAFGPWPDGVPVQIHGMDADQYFAGEGDVDAAKQIVETVPDAELFLYPGDRHLFTDSSLPSYDEAATTELTARVIRFLEKVDAASDPADAD